MQQLQTPINVHKQRVVQTIAKQVLEQIGPTLNSNDTELSIAARAVQMMKAQGINETWYYNCPAFVLLGERSRLSQSGRNYEAATQTVGATNLVTIDLSPMHGGLWGDCARSFCIEDDCHTLTPVNVEFIQGLAAEQTLHEAMKGFVKPSTTFQSLYEFANQKIKALEFENLDFANNVGHSIVLNRDDRIYIEAANQKTLGSVDFFTFEPHVAQSGSNWGFKHEQIYFFNADGLLEVL